MCRNDWQDFNLTLLLVVFWPLFVHFVFSSKKLTHISFLNDVFFSFNILVGAVLLGRFVLWYTCSLDVSLKTFSFYTQIVKYLMQKLKYDNITIKQLQWRSIATGHAMQIYNCLGQLR